MDIQTRKEQLEKLFHDFIVPDTNQTLSRAGIIELAKKGRIDSSSRKKGTWDLGKAYWSHIRRKFFEAESGIFRSAIGFFEKSVIFLCQRKLPGLGPARSACEYDKKKEAPIIDELIEKIKNRITQGKQLLTQSMPSSFNAASSGSCALRAELVFILTHLSTSLSLDAQRVLATCPWQKIPQSHETSWQTPKVSGQIAPKSRSSSRYLSQRTPERSCDRCQNPHTIKRRQE